MSQLPNVPMAELRPLIHKGRKPAPSPADINLFKRPAYTCPELGRTCNRPNAYDAFDLPSIYAGERRPYRFSQD